MCWFDESHANFEPVSIRDLLNNGNLHLTDGHSRAYVAWTKGLKQIPCVYDESPIVSNRIGQIQYENDIEWCERFQLRHISRLLERILLEEEYETLWRGRCGYMYDLEVALTERSISRPAFRRRKAELEGLGVFVYGISEDFQTIHCENAAGELFEFPFHA